MTEQDIQAIRLLMREELAPVNKRLDRLEEGQAELRQGMAELREGQEELREGQEELREGQEELREGQEELRGCVNLLLEWADKVSETYQFPLPRP